MRKEIDPEKLPDEIRGIPRRNSAGGHPAAR